jgi:hypothetical protein
MSRELRENIMSISLYDSSVGTYLQIVGATAGFMAKGAKHCADNDIDLKAVVATRLYPDMANFHFQAVSVAHHSIGAIKGLQSGEFGPPVNYADTDFAGLQALIGQSLDALKALDADSINALSGGQVTFKLGDNQIPFTTENFILCFSLPNLYFHATTAYDILRMQGVPLGKRDFLGRMRVGV